MSTRFDSPLNKAPASVASPRLVYVALMIGVLGFTAFAAVNVNLQLVATSSAARIPLLLALAAIGLSNPTMIVVLGAAFVKQARAKWSDSTATEAERDAAVRHVFATRSILTAALMEGWGLFGAVTLLITGDWLALGAPIITCAVLLAFMPSAASFQRFLAAVRREP